MPLEITTLAVGSVNARTPPTTLQAGDFLYKPSTNPPRKTAIVHGMRFTNVGSAVAKVQVFFMKNNGTIGTDERRILPKDVTLPANYTVIDEDQVTLDSGDGIYAFSDTAGATIDFMLSGSERPA